MEMTWTGVQEYLFSLALPELQFVVKKHLSGDTNSALPLVCEDYHCNLDVGPLHILEEAWITAKGDNNVVFLTRFAQAIRRLLSETSNLASRGELIGNSYLSYLIQIVLRTWEVGYTDDLTYWRILSEDTEDTLAWKAYECLAGRAK